MCSHDEFELPFTKGTQLGIPSNQSGGNGEKAFLNLVHMRA